MAEGNEIKTEHYKGVPIPGVHLIKVNEARQIWVDPEEVAAIGEYGQQDTIIILKSGKELVAKGTSPNEVAQLVAGLIATEEVGR